MHVQIIFTPTKLLYFVTYTKLRCTIVDRNSCYLLRMTVDIKSHTKYMYNSAIKALTSCVSLCLLITKFLAFKDSSFPVSLRQILDTSGKETVLSKSVESVPGLTQSSVG